MDQFANRLKQARKMAGLTQEQVSFELEISRSNISKYENGDISPNIKTIRELMKLYKVDANYLFGSEDDDMLT